LIIQNNMLNHYLAGMWFLLLSTRISCGTESTSLAFVVFTVEFEDLLFNVPPDNIIFIYVTYICS